MSRVRAQRVATRMVQAMDEAETVARERDDEALLDLIQRLHECVKPPATEHVMGASMAVVLATAECNAIHNKQEGVLQFMRTLRAIFDAK